MRYLFSFDARLLLSADFVANEMKRSNLNALGSKKVSIVAFLCNDY